MDCENGDSVANNWHKWPCSSSSSKIHASASSLPHSSPIYSPQISSTELVMAIYTTAPGTPSFLDETYLYEVFSNLINFYGHTGPLAVSPLPPNGQPAKRARTVPAKATKDTRVSSARKSRGCLSELPTMPMDILFEIFAQLHPSDLLSVSRVNKSFRGVLLSRNSSFLWNACLRLCGAPTSPRDMSPPAWTHLLFGGAYCYSCDKKPVNRILFSLRRRACKSCMSKHLCCSTKVPEEFRDMIPYDSGHSSSIHPSRYSCTKHWWDEDVTALSNEVGALKTVACDSDGTIIDKEAAISDFFARKKEEAAAITEHALICTTWEKDRNADRSNILSDARTKRFEDIKTRFLPLGYSAEDVDQLRRHREVRTSKPMSNRVWQRVEPLLRPGANEARDRRLMREDGDTYLTRRQVVLGEYATFLEALSPVLLSLSPTATQFLCQNRDLADALALGTGPDDPSLTDLISEAIHNLGLELEIQRRERAALLRSLLPETDVPEDATDEEAISLATSVYKCSDCHLPTSGPYMLAHKCEQAPKANTLHPRLSGIGRATVEILLRLIGLGRKTTGLELDRRSDRFVCMRCPRGSFPQNGKEVLGRCVRDWRSCISHAIGTKNERSHTGGPIWHLVGPPERAGLSWEGFVTTHSYGCMHCPARIDLSKGVIQWYTNIGAIKEHVRNEHERNEPLEGEDFFFNFSMRRLGCKSLLAMDQ